MTPTLLQFLAWLWGVSALFGVGYTVLSALLVGRFFARPAAEPASFPPVTVVKPLFGREFALAANLESFCAQNYPGPIQFLFGANAADDPALEAVAELRRRHPDAQVTLITDPRLHGSNRKVSNLLNMLPHARHEMLVFADSDVGVAPDYLRRIVGELQSPGTKLVTCVYHGQPDSGFWPRLSAMATNCQFLPGVVTGLALGMARPCFGQTIAMRRKTLDEIGGLAQFAHHLAEDHAIGEAVRAIGGKVAIPPFAISHACVESSFARLVSHELRWSRTIRSIDPVGHFGSVLVHPFVLALFAVLFSGGSSWAWILALAALLARLALKLGADRALRQSSRDIWLLPLWDLAAFGIFVASFLSTRVIWRGFSFSVDGDGILSPIGDRRR